MKRKSREISIFSMSALDLFSSALGAFILIAVVIFLFFPNTGIADQLDLEEARRQAASLQQELSEAEEALADASARERGLEEALEQERKRKFLLVTISWQGEHDVDLHIVDPRGNEYSYNARTHSGSVARFEEDTTRGPGNEVWLHPMVTPGEYRVYYHLFAQRGSSVPVRGSVVHSLDRDELRLQTLREQGDKPLVATVVVDADANVEVRQ